MLVCLLESQGLWSAVEYRARARALRYGAHTAYRGARPECAVRTAAALLPPEVPESAKRALARAAGYDESVPPVEPARPVVLSHFCSRLGRDGLVVEPPVWDEGDWWVEEEQWVEARPTPANAWQRVATASEVVMVHHAWAGGWVRAVAVARYAEQEIARAHSAPLQLPPHCQRSPTLTGDGSVRAWPTVDVGAWQGAEALTPQWQSAADPAGPWRDTTTRVCGEWLRVTVTGTSAGGTRAASSAPYGPLQPPVDRMPLRARLYPRDA